MKGTHEGWKKNESSSSKSILNSIRAKVIVGFFLFAVAIAVSWLVVNFTIDEMVSTVDRLSKPNHKLILADDLFKHIVQLDQNQKARAIENPHLPVDQLMEGSEQLRRKLDTLYVLLYDNEEQLRRIDSMRILLGRRDKLFSSYLKLRAEMGDNKSFKEKIGQMSELLMKRKAIDSSVVSTEKKITTTTIIPEREEDKKKEPNFFERLFNVGSKGEEPKIPQPHRIVKREEDIRIDTVAANKRDTILDQAVNLMDELQHDQQIRNLRLKRQEFALLNSSGLLVRNLMKLSHDIQETEIREEKNANKAKTLFLENGIRRYSYLIFVFFIGSGLIVFLIFFDISKSNHFRKKLEQAKEEAERLNQVKQRFLANMSHEIRTPLQSISGFAEQMFYHKGQNSEKAAHAIYHSSHHLLHVVNEILDYNKIESNKFSLDNQAFNMEAVLTEVADVVNQQCVSKQISFKYEVDFDLLKDRFYLGDAFRLKQILYNLLGNAVKFTQRGDVCLRVSSSPVEEETTFVFMIEDSGMGISEADRQRIFQKFEQVNQDGAPKDGIGLGLSIVQELVYAKGGTLQLESSPGRGSCFYVNLTYPNAERPAELEYTHPRLLQGGEANRVVMIDDDRFILDLCASIFERQQVAFKQYRSAEEFLATDWEQSSEEFTMLIDVVLPGLSGKDLAQKVRSALGDRVTMVAVTAQVLKEEVQSIVRSGFNDVLKKPFKERELLQAIGVGSVNGSEYTEIASGEADLSNLVNMAAGDMELVREFIGEFISDCSSDLAELDSAIKGRQKEQMADLVHRLAGRCGQFGARQLAVTLRKHEASLRNGVVYEKLHYEEMESVVSRIKTLMEELSKTKIKETI